MNFLRLRWRAGLFKPIGRTMIALNRVGLSHQSKRSLKRVLETLAVFQKDAHSNFLHIAASPTSLGTSLLYSTLMGLCFVIYSPSVSGFNITRCPSN